MGNATSGPKKIISVKGVSDGLVQSADHQGKTSADVYRNIYGNALTEVSRFLPFALYVLTSQRVQNIRVSSEGRRVEGFISLHGAISQVSTDNTHKQL